MRFNFNFRFFNINKFLLILFILILTSLIAIYSFDLFNNLDFGKLVDYFYNNNNIEPNNQISSRDVNNVTSNLTSNETNSTIPDGVEESHRVIIYILAPIFGCMLIATVALAFFIPLGPNH